jgi:copper(I)-binding protein
MRKSPTPNHGRVGGVSAGLLCLVLALFLASCTTTDVSEPNSPGVNLTTSEGLDIADLRIGSFQAAPYPAGADVLVLARIVAQKAADRLLGASSSAAAGARLVGADGTTVPALTIPAGGVLDLTAKGPHIVLSGISDNLPEGGRIPLTLRFERSGEVTTDVARRIDGDNTYTRSP